MDEPTFDKMAMPPRAGATRLDEPRMIKMAAPEGATAINPGGHGEYVVVDGYVSVPESLPQSAHDALAAHGYVRT